jgi:hypothetical protein
MATFKSLNNQGSCDSLSNIYTKAKSVNNINSLSSSTVVDLNGLIGI